MPHPNSLGGAKRYIYYICVRKAQDVVVDDKSEILKGGTKNGSKGKNPCSS